MTMMLRLAAAFLVCLEVAGACAKKVKLSASRQLQVGSDPSILAIIASNTELTTLDAAVTVAGIDQDLIDLTLTALAPTNAGFATLDLTLFNNLLFTPAWELHLAEILEYHLSNNPAYTFTLQNGSEITMRNGEIVFVSARATLSGTGSIYTFSNSEKEVATLTQADIFADNGVVHIIDNVLKPSFLYRSVVDLFRGTYSTLQNLALIAGLEGYLRDDTFTLFAPTNDAFNLLPATRISFLSSPAGNADLVEILQYHAVEAVFPSTFLENGVGLPTTQGKSISIRIVRGTIMANDATVIDADILALNGITHGIDRVLVIPDNAGQPTNAPVAGRPTNAPVRQNQQIFPTIYMLAADNPDLSTLTMVLETSGLDEILDDPATLTALFPTNAAFDEIPSDFFANLLTPAFSQHLFEILQYHVSDEIFGSAGLFAGKTITMLNGETVTYFISDTGVGAFNARAIIETGTIKASNGVAHIIDQVLVPSFGRRTTVELGSDYSTWLSLIELASLTSTLGGGAWTLFAPTNTAFEKLDQATADFWISTAGKDVLIEVLTYHAVPQVFTSEKLSNGAMLATAQGDRVAISVVNSQVMVDDANVVSPDILAFNGVTHGIDTVLMPLIETLAPTSAPMSATPTLLPTLSPTLAPTFLPTLSLKKSNSAAGVLGSSLLGLFVTALTAGLVL
jgi:transforming growth factor-beta-induced protein